MNLNKARDFYSAHYEGSLDEGLNQAFERALASDAAISAEYRQFVRIMQEMRAVAKPVSVPSDLHLKIRERVDANINAQEKAARTAGWFFGWKPIAYGALATAAIISVVASLTNRPTGGTSTAGVATISDSAPKVAVVQGELKLQFSSSKKNQVTVTEVATGRALLNRAVVGQRLESPVRNLSEAPVVLSISFAEQYRPIYVALPGSKMRLAETGSGTVLDLMAAVSGMFSVPVVVEAAEVDSKVDWMLDSPDVMAALADELKGLGLKAEVREGGLVWLSSN